MLLGIALATALFFCAVSVLVQRRRCLKIRRGLNRKNETVRTKAQVPPHGNVKLCDGQSVSLLRDLFNYNLANFLAKKAIFRRTVGLYLPTIRAQQSPYPTADTGSSWIRTTKASVMAP